MEEKSIYMIYTMAMSIIIAMVTYLVAYYAGLEAAASFYMALGPAGLLLGLLTSGVPAPSRKLDALDNSLWLLLCGGLGLAVVIGVKAAAAFGPRTGRS